MELYEVINGLDGNGLIVISWDHVFESLDFGGINLHSNVEVYKPAIKNDRTFPFVTIGQHGEMRFA